MKFLHFLKRIVTSTWIKTLAGLVFCIVLFACIFAVDFNHRCSISLSSYTPVTSTSSPELLATQQGIENYFRTEETTYITFPEWYLVFNPQEYARFLHTEKPSSFPYFASIDKFWSSYCQVYGISKMHYSFNVDNHVVESVIGSSFTVEFVIKGLYENTIGRLSEILGGYTSDEDRYAAEIAREYGEFIPNLPWFEFPYDRAFLGLWADTSFWGWDMARKVERKFFLSIEYGVKAIYAQIIKRASHSAFGVAATEVYATIHTPTTHIFGDARVKKVRDVRGGLTIITLPHYQGFTDVVPLLAHKGVRFVDVSGNDEILMSAIVPVDFSVNLKPSNILFSMDILTDPTNKRLALQVPVSSLKETILKVENGGGVTEHLYDY
jgi:hypothetical protein